MTVSAMRSPRPVFWKPSAKKKASRTSQTTSSVNARSPSAKVMVFVKMATADAMRVMPAGGKGLSTTPQIIETNIASMDHACAVTLSGFGTAKRMTQPTARHTASSRTSAPSQPLPFFASPLLPVLRSLRPFSPSRNSSTTTSVPPTRSASGSSEPAASSGASGSVSAPPHPPAPTRAKLVPAKRSAATHAAAATHSSEWIGLRMWPLSAARCDSIARVGSKRG
mmetsp:Transcript_87947/g.257110  ORF Transcript_87947/g.257110 Transcript_87947/m.257110 type:complete len:224 (+) Transcript_87947:394-1065(+)